MSSTFCPLPWIGIATRNNGDLRVCCHSTNSKGKGFALKADGSYFNAADGVTDFRNADLLKSIRVDMLQGKWPENCVRCQTETEAGLRSRIEYERHLNQDVMDFEKAKATTKADGEINIQQVPVTLLDIRFGNHCNLACRTCNPTESSRWYGDHYELYGNSFKYGEQKLELVKKAGGSVTVHGGQFDWFEKESFVDSIPALLKDVKQIYISGGEPLKTKAHADFLKTIMELGLQKQMTLEYNTNGYVIPDGVWELWKEFKLVKVGLSIDSIARMNDYIRHPSKWNILSENIRRFDESGDQFIVWLALTVHCYNIFYLPEIISWRILSNFKKFNNSMDNLILSDHPLHNPEHLNIQILPPAVKKAVAQKFAEFKKTLPSLIDKNDFMRGHAAESQDRIHAFLDGYVHFMNQTQRQNSYPKFLKYTENLDKIRGESFADVFPEWNEILSNHTP